MAISSKNVLEAIQTSGLLPLFYHPDIEISKKVIKACFDGGACVFEFTNRGGNAHEVFQALYQYVSAELPAMILGVGTVMNAEAASLFIRSGASFIVSPIMNPEVGRVCSDNDIAWIPGCGTLTEMVNATEHGAQLVKMFPAQQIGGAGFVRAVKGPCPWLNIIPTGGVSPDEANLREWFDAGVTCVGMGSKLIQENNMKDLSAKVAATLELIKIIRAENSNHK